MRWLTHGGALSLVACCSAGAGDSLVESEADTAEDRFVTEVEAPEPLWTATEAAEALMAALADGYPTAADYQVHFEETVGENREDGPPPCPTEGPLGWEAWEDLIGCETTEGWEFAGLAEYSDQARIETDSAVVQFGLVSDFEIRSPDGGSFDSGGGAGHRSIYDRSLGLVQVEDWIGGSFEITWADDWFVGNVSGTMTTNYDSLEGALTADGSVSWGEVSLLFQDFVVDPRDCEGVHAIQGKVHLRGQESAWYVFDFGDECQRCAEVTFHVDTALGEACVDLEEPMQAQGDRLIAAVLALVEAADTGGTE